MGRVVRSRVDRAYRKGPIGIIGWFALSPTTHDEQVPGDFQLIVFIEHRSPVSDGNFPLLRRAGWQDDIQRELSI